MARKRQNARSLLASLPPDLRKSITSSNKSEGGKVQVEDRLEKSNKEAVRPAKRRKANSLLKAGLEKYDATGLVPFYANYKEVPDRIQKYYSQRLRLFSRYEEGCLLDEEGWFSVTPELIADQIAERCRCDTIIDAFCGVGGNSIAFARTCERVIAIDNSPIRLALARHNAALYGVVDRIEFILADFVSFARSLPTSAGRTVDVIFLSPPWGGVNYQTLSTPNSRLNGTSARDDSFSIAAKPQEVEDAQDSATQYSLDNLTPLDGKELFTLARKITPNVAFFLPRNQDLEEVGALVTARSGDGGQTEVVEVEEEWMGNKLKALTCYFGGLAQGQGHLWS